MDTPWGALILRLPREHADEMAGMLGAHALGVESHPVDHLTAELRVYLATPHGIAALRGEACRLLESAGLGGAVASVRTEEVADERWVETYQAQLVPFDIGHRFRVYPAGRVAPDSEKESLVLVPGRAFGTGEHPTTRLCTTELERRVERGSRWLDVGCGTGILSLIAVRVGAEHVRAVDIDPDAIHVSREVLEQNGAEAQVELRVGGIEACGDEVWNGVVCNISASFALGHMPELAARVADAGWLMVSGFLGEELSAIAGAASREGVIEIARAEQGAWAVWVGRRPSVHEA